MPRTDVHSPKHLITEEYEFAFAYDRHTPWALGRAGDELKALRADGWEFVEIDGHDSIQCDHCGAWIRYVGVLKHLPSHKLISVGETCLSNRFSLATEEFHRLRLEAKLNRERATKDERKAKFTEENLKVVTFLAERHERSEAGLERPNDFYSSLYSQLNDKGELSERQIAAVERGIIRWAENAEKFAERKAEREAEAAEAIPVVTGKHVDIAGKILSINVKVNAYGERLVMTVKDDRGFKVWGTVPKTVDSELVSLIRAELAEAPMAPSGGVLAPVDTDYQNFVRTHNVRVAFTAGSVERSDRDESFGFFKRPAEAKLLIDTP